MFFYANRVRFFQFNEAVLAEKRFTSRKNKVSLNAKSATREDEVANTSELSKVFPAGGSDPGDSRDCLR